MAAQQVPNLTLALARLQQALDKFLQQFQRTEEPSAVQLAQIMDHLTQISETLARLEGKVNNQ